MLRSCWTTQQKETPCLNAGLTLSQEKTGDEETGSHLFSHDDIKCYGFRWSECLEKEIGRILIYRLICLWTRLPAVLWQHLWIKDTINSFEYVFCTHTRNTFLHLSLGCIFTLLQWFSWRTQLHLISSCMFPANFPPPQNKTTSKHVSSHTNTCKASLALHTRVCLRHTGDTQRNESLQATQSSMISSMNWRWSHTAVWPLSLSTYWKPYRKQLNFIFAACFLSNFYSVLSLCQCMCMPTKATWWNIWPRMLNLTQNIKSVEQNCLAEGAFSCNYCSHVC